MHKLLNQILKLKSLYISKEEYNELLKLEDNNIVDMLNTPYELSSTINDFIDECMNFSAMYELDNLNEIETLSVYTADQNELDVLNIAKKIAMLEAQFGKCLMAKSIHHPSCLIRKKMSILKYCNDTQLSLLNTLAKEADSEYEQIINDYLNQLEEITFKEFYINYYRNHLSILKKAIAKKNLKDLVINLADLYGTKLNCYCGKSKDYIALKNQLRYLIDTLNINFYAQYDYFLKEVLYKEEKANLNKEMYKLLLLKNE